MTDQEDTLELMAGLCEGKTWEEIGGLFGTVLKKIIPSPTVAGERLRELPSTRAGLWAIARVMVEGCTEAEGYTSSCIHPFNKVYESAEVEGQVICYACNEVLIDPPPDPEETATLGAEEQVRRQSRPDDIT